MLLAKIVASRCARTNTIRFTVRDFVTKVRTVEASKQPGATDLTEAVARYYFKLLAIKDEYKVARLYAKTDFVQRVAAQFEGDTSSTSTSRRQR